MNLFTIELRTWDANQPASVQDAAIAALEGGSIIVFPHLAFPLQPSDLKFLDPHSVHGAKNVSYNPATGKVGGTNAEGAALDELRGLLNRFGRATGALVRGLLPAYASGLQHGRGSLRPVEI